MRILGKCFFITRLLWQIYKSLITFRFILKSHYMEELSELFKSNFKKMNEMCRHYRGAFIHTATHIESTINIILSNYFCGHDLKKRKEIFYSVFNSERITLAHKIQVVQFIYRNHFKEFDKKYNLSILQEFKSRSKHEKKNPNAKKPITLDSKLVLC